MQVAIRKSSKVTMLVYYLEKLYFMRVEETSSGGPYTTKYK